MQRLANLIPPTKVLASWRELGVRVRTQVPPPRVPNWGLCVALRDATIRYALAKQEPLLQFLQESELRMSPLPDPLRGRFLLHRWLSNDREESYSDWLAWIFGELGTPDRVGLILYEDKNDIPTPLLECTDPCKTHRELVVPKGHPDSGGRLDCLLRFGVKAVVVIEVKLTRAEDADTEKQKGYSEWLDNQPQPSEHKFKFLIALDGDAEEDYYGFKLLLWRDVCKRLRRLLPSLISENRLPLAALIAAFVGAVEQNLMELPSLGRIGIREGQMNPIVMLDRLEDVLDQLRW
jgi:hypothetical protein